MVTPVIKICVATGSDVKHVQEDGEDGAEDDCERIGGHHTRRGSRLRCPAQTAPRTWGKQYGCG